MPHILSRAGLAALASVCLMILPTTAFAIQADDPAALAAPPAKADPPLPGDTPANAVALRAPHGRRHGRAGHRHHGHSSHHVSHHSRSSAHHAHRSRSVKKRRK